VLENNKCVGKGKEYHNIFKMAITCVKCCISFVTFLNTH
jgi:hypothetical protein